MSVLCVSTYECVCVECVEENKKEEMKENVSKKMENEKFLLTRVLEVENGNGSVIFEMLNIRKFRYENLDELLEVLLCLYNISCVDLFRCIYNRYGERMKEMYELSEEEYKYITK